MIAAFWSALLVSAMAMTQGNRLQVVDSCANLQEAQAVILKLNDQINSTLFLSEQEVTFSQH